MPELCSQECKYLDPRDISHVVDWCLEWVVAFVFDFVFDFDFDFDFGWLERIVDFDFGWRITTDAVGRLRRFMRIWKSDIYLEKVSFYVNFGTIIRM